MQFNRTGLDLNMMQDSTIAVVQHTAQPSKLRDLVRLMVKDDALYWDIVNRVFFFYQQEKEDRSRTQTGKKEVNLVGYAEDRTKAALGTTLKEHDFVVKFGKALTVKQYRQAH